MNNNVNNHELTYRYMDFTNVDHLYCAKCYTYSLYCSYFDCDVLLEKSATHKWMLRGPWQLTGILDISISTQYRCEICEIKGRWVENNNILIYDKYFKYYSCNEQLMILANK